MRLFAYLLLLVTTSALAADTYIAPRHPGLGYLLRAGAYDLPTQVCVTPDGAGGFSAIGGGGGSSAAPDGRSKVALITHDFAATPVTDSAYTQILASSSDIINYLDIWNESGRALYLAVGAAASEVDQIYIFPSGNDEPLRIPAGSRLSIKSVSGTISTDLIRINALK